MSESKHKSLKPSVAKPCYKYCPLKSQISFLLRLSKDTGPGQLLSKLLPKSYFSKERCPLFLSGINTKKKPSWENQESFPNWRNKPVPNTTHSTYNLKPEHLSLKVSGGWNNQERRTYMRRRFCAYVEKQSRRKWGTCAEERFNMCFSRTLYYNFHISWVWHGACKQALTRFVEPTCTNTYWGNLPVSTYLFQLWSAGAMCVHRTEWERVQVEEGERGSFCG